MAQFGVTPQGFARKRLPDILTDIEADARTAFGAGVIQTPQSPLGQWNGLAALLASKMWEIAEGVYQSSDPDQAEGVRLEGLARLRLVERFAGETDESLRLAITNAGRARIDMADLNRSVRNIAGVTWAHITVNDSTVEDANGIPPQTVSVAVIGGDDAEIAAQVRAYVVPGIGTHGNVQASTVIEGYCRTVNLTRPVDRQVSLSLTVETWPGAGGCPPPTVVAMAQAISEQLSGDRRPANGADIDLHMLQVALSCRFPNVRIVTAQAAFGPAFLPGPLPLAVGFFEIAAITASNITISVV
jgi:hypothetical protein